MLIKFVTNVLSPQRLPELTYVRRQCQRRRISPTPSPEFRNAEPTVFHPDLPPTPSCFGSFFCLLEKESRPRPVPSRPEWSPTRSSPVETLRSGGVERRGAGQSEGWAGQRPLRQPITGECLWGGGLPQPIKRVEEFVIESGTELFSFRDLRILPRIITITDG